jgi:hypothetical protein
MDGALACPREEKLMRIYEELLEIAQNYDRTISWALPKCENKAGAPPGVRFAPDLRRCGQSSAIPKQPDPTCPGFSDWSVRQGRAILEQSSAIAPDNPDAEIWPPSRQKTSPANGSSPRRP